MKYSVLPKNCNVPRVDLTYPSAKRIAEIKREVEQHVGQSAIYTFPEKRSTDSRLVTIHAVCERFAVLRYPCYDLSGNLRQYLMTSVLFTSILCGEESLKYVEDDI